MKMAIEAIKKTLTDKIMGMENLGKLAKTTDASITNKIQEMEERTSAIEDMTIKKNCDAPNKVNAKYEKFQCKSFRKFGTL